MLNHQLPSVNKEAVEDVLIIQVSRIGDTLLSTPTIRAVSEYFPSAKITVLGHPKRVDILCNIPFVYRVGTISKYSAKFKGWLTRKSYDIAFVFGFDAPLIEYALRVAHKVVAFKQPSDRLNTRLFHAVTPPLAMSRHAVYMQYALVEPLQIPLHNPVLAYQVAPEEKLWASRFLQGKELGDSSFPLIGLQIASFPTKGYRDWPVENFFQLASKILDKFPKAHFLIFGGALEQDRTKTLSQQLGGRSTHLAGVLSLRQTAALMNMLDYYIGVDTGPTHIMGALHRPMMSMYHPSSPSEFLAPLNHPALTVIDHPSAGLVGPEASMAELTVDAVWSKLLPDLELLPAR